MPPIFTGHRGAQIEYILLVCAAYIITAILGGGGVRPLWSFLVFLALPQGMACVKRVFNSSPSYTVDIRTADINSAKHHVLFGVLLVLSLVIATFMKV